MKKTAGINGFGRFGQHLLRYWIKNYDSAFFTIDYINDSKLSLVRAYELLTTDRYLGGFLKSRISLAKDGFVVFLPNDTEQHIKYSNRKDGDIEWNGEPVLFFECSGMNTNAHNCNKFLRGNTRQVIISATSLNADALLVYGYNHSTLSPAHHIISYGSCTINAFVPLATFINAKYKVIDSSVDVIHNVPEYLLEDTLIRKGCTLEKVAPQLLPFITKDNFTVNYTLIPYTGVSIIDFRFRVKNVPQLTQLLNDLKMAIGVSAPLNNLYKINTGDAGPQEHKFTPYSAVLIEPNIKIVGDSVYIHSYFDNENSVNRYFDLTNEIVVRLP